MAQRSKCDFRGPDADVPAVGAPSQIWTYCLDSHNVVRWGPENNPTNDMVIQVKMTVDRQTFRSMELVTAEIPMSDFIPCTLRVQRDLNLPLCEEERTLKNLNGCVHVLPPTWNRAEYEGDGLYRTEVPHRLKSSPGDMWLWGGSNPVLLAHHGEVMHNVRIMSEHTFRVDGCRLEDVLYVWSTPLTFKQIADWLELPFDDTCARMEGFAWTPLYSRLTNPSENEIVCNVPCVRRQCTANDLKDQLQIASDAYRLPDGASITITDYDDVEIASLELPAGYFNPEALCRELTRGHVTTAIKCDRLHFSSRKPFKVEFKGRGCDGTFFGFAFEELKGQTSYEADKALCWCLPKLEWEVVDCAKLAVCRKPVNGCGQLDGTAVNFEDTHNFQVDDAVIVRVGEQSRLTRVIGTSLYSINVDLSWENEAAACTVESFPAPLFFFGAQRDPVLGFMTHTRSGGWFSAQPVDVRGPTYVMMQIVDPTGSAQCEHISADGNSSGYIGKCVFLSLFRTLNEHAPRLFKFFPNRRVTEIHVRLLNPDGTLYQMYGLPWSATLLFRT